MSLHAVTEMALILVSDAMMSLIVSKIFKGRIVQYQEYTVPVSQNRIPFCKCVLYLKREQRERR